jgi:hypothetical protein
MEKSQDNKDTSLSKNFNKLIIEKKKSQVRTQEVNNSDKFKNLSLKQRQQLGIRYLKLLMT